MSGTTPESGLETKQEVTAANPADPFSFLQTWERLKTAGGIYYFRTMSGLIVHTQAEIVALTTLSKQKASQTHLPERKGWGVSEEAGDVRYIHSLTGTAVNTAEQAAALDELYQRHPKILKAIQNLHQQQEELEKLELESSQNSALADQYQSALASFQILAAQVAAMEEDESVQAEAKAPVNTTEVEAERPVKPKPNKSKAKTGLKVLLALAAGVGLGLLLAATFPAVLGAFVNLAILMTLGGTAATIGGFVMLGLAGLLAAGLLVGTAVGINYAFTKKLEAPDAQLLKITSQEDLPKLPENWQWGYDDQDKLQAIRYENGDWKEATPCNDVNNTANLAASIWAKSGQPKPQEEAEKTGLEPEVGGWQAVSAASLHPGGDSAGAIPLTDVIHTVIHPREEPRPSETSEGGSTAPKPSGSRASDDSV